MSDLRAVVEAISLGREVSFEWLGKTIPVLSPSMARKLGGNVARAHMVQKIKNFLYTNFYMRGEPCEPRSTPLQGTAARSQFVQDILFADSGQNKWHYGGVIHEVFDDHVIVECGTLKVQARLEDCISPTLPLVKGAKVRLRLGRNSLRSSPGFCLLFGDFDLPAEGPKLRFYWNLDPGLAVRFVSEATSRLNASHIPFRLKVLTDPLAYDRCDAGVLYIERSGLGAVADEIAKVYSAIGPLREKVPAFTRKLAPGLAAADDPGNGESFGMHRCGLLAEALMLAFEQGVYDTDGRSDFVYKFFASVGIDHERPFLQPDLLEPDFGSLQAEHFPVPDRRRATVSQFDTTNSVTDKSDWFAAAATIGSRIAAEAVWYQDRCQWLGAEPVLPGPSGAIEYRTLPAGLYSGTAGVALFLGELSYRSGDLNIKRTALGAIRQALRRTSADVGLYPGGTGIALVAARLGAILDEPWLSEQALKLAGRVLRKAPTPGEYDLMYGSAGRILGAFALESLLDVPAIKAAERQGRALLRSAHRSDSGWSWAGQDRRWTQNLTGLSHGAAGVAQGLAVLWQRTGNDAYKRAAVGAITYEQMHFNAEVGNWPDLRPLPVGHAGERIRYGGYWCHGAPGIALQRLSIATILESSEYLNQARIGMETTATRLAASLQRNVENYSLCHGLLGNAEVLVEWANCSGDPLYRAYAEEAAYEGLRLYAENGKWPCGTVQGDTPSLMLGRAGIGYFYLRLADPKIPSVLLIDPTTWRPRKAAP
ncbi:hypothetical protein GR239_24905 [Rhizobium leguminosarum]|uniref:lanthionine synthetase LanC family protein n=1 Tax=Rhizobium TaxID=379 RepID=UPI00102F6E64|nr:MULTISPECIES: lanthionine synthetase LanC family protein [Rhizobium]MBY5856125.1 hypothetical protein [Rhizobium leguminosarum]NEH86797.1 hypothetical protein [Rhizobium ruizarguesonis]NEI15881.1 hypothetical protein [Rhizobium ruizarguesonis]NEJ59852.1 hypothetical protein [Rhizobium ruizarguesonis]NEJ65711.1 hypothetical protein [Rhizobium ruizarguesonis]